MQLGYKVIERTPGEPGERVLRYLPTREATKVFLTGLLRGAVEAGVNREYIVRRINGGDDGGGN